MCQKRCVRDSNWLVGSDLIKFYVLYVCTLIFFY